jgi:RNA polymerase sigma factor (sigma-70 family)
MAAQNEIGIMNVNRIKKGRGKMTMLMTEKSVPVGKMQLRGLEDLTSEERRLYESIPDEVDFEPHPAYQLEETEERLFGPQAEAIPVVHWRQYPEFEDDEMPAPKSRAQLTRRQETVLFMRYNFARYRLLGLKTAQEHRFSRPRMREMIEWYKRVLESRAQLVNANMALVVAMAKRTRINSVEFSELVSEGNMALLRAVDKFDVRRGFKFSTYACRAILKSFNRLATKTGTYRQHFPTEFEPDFERSDDGDRRHRDEHDLAIEDLQRVLVRNIAQLSDVEKAVVSARFAVAGQGEAQTLEQVGKLVGLSKERVRQVQNDALNKLREAVEAQAG